MLNCNIVLTLKYAIKHKTQSGKFDNSVEQVELDQRKRQWIQEGGCREEPYQIILEILGKWDTEVSISKQLPGEVDGAYWTIQVLQSYTHGVRAPNGDIKIYQPRNK